MDKDEKFSSHNRWVDVVLVDGNIFSGSVLSSASYGIYIFIGGDADRLNLFPWAQVNRVLFRKKEN
jgi:hypothetical protein